MNGILRTLLAVVLLGPGASQDAPRPGLVAEVYDTSRWLDALPKPADQLWLLHRFIDPRICHESAEGPFAGAKIADHFYVKWTGLLRVPTAEEWTFFLESDDGSRLFLDGKELVNHDGVHGMSEKSATLNLTAGDHHLAIDYYDRGGPAGIKLSWSAPSRAKELVPADVFFHPKDPLDRPAPPEDLKLRWKLEPNQFARYRIYAIGDAKPGEFLDHDPHYQVGLFGYELDDKRLYHPQLQIAREIPLILTQTLPDRPLHTGKPVDLDLLLDRGWDYEPARAKGKIERIKSSGPGLVTYTVNAKIAGLKAKTETRQARIKECTVAAEVDFDPDRGAVTRIRFDFDFMIEGGQPVGWVRELRLVDIVTRRHPTFESEVNRAIDLGVDRVWRFMDPKENHWGAWYDFKEGPSALALLTILKGSLDRKDPRIEKALDWTLNHPMTFTYSVAISLMAVEAYYSPLDPGKRFKAGEIADKEIAAKISAEHKKFVEGAASWLLSKQRDNYWAYPGGTQDYSNSQYAILGLLAAQRCGVAVDDAALVNLVNRLLQSQERKGPAVRLTLIDDLAPGATNAETAANALGWGYRENPDGDGGARASMALGAIGTLTILDHMLLKMGSTRYKPELRGKVQAAIRNGWAWLATNWSVKVNWNAGVGWQFYTLYALERAGMLGGVGTVNGHDWYWEGAAWLIANMAGDGTWCDHGFVNLQDTCFAVLFLKRATIRVASGEKK